MTSSALADAPPSLVELSPASSVLKCASSLRAGQWQAAGLDALASSVSVSGAVVDPAGTVLRLAAEWVLEHVDPLNRLLDMVAGEAAQARARAAQMTQLAVRLRNESGPLAVHGWVGAAASGHRQHVSALRSDCAAAADAAEAGAEALREMAVFVDGARSFIRALIAELIAWGVKSAAAAGVTAGLAGGPLVVALGIRVGLAMDRAAPLVRALIATARALDGQLSALSGAVAELGRKVAARARGNTVAPRPTGPPGHSALQREARSFHDGPTGAVRAASANAILSAEADHEREQGPRGP